MQAKTTGAGTLSVRRAVTEDNEAIFSLRKQLHVSAELSQTTFAEIVSELLAQPNHCVLVLEADGNVVAYASGYQHVTLYAGGSVAYLDEIVVAHEVRGKKLGTLLQAFEQWAKAEGCILNGLATGGARAFYEKLGYASKAGYYKKWFK